MFELVTDRLRLLPLNLDCLELLVQGRTLMESHLGLMPSNLQLDKIIQTEIKEAQIEWLEGVRANPIDYCWLTNWEIILKSENRIVGGIGLHRVNTSEVMVGYAMDKRYYNQGIATESLNALKNWVFTYPFIQKMMADTPIENVASQKVLIKNRFVEKDRNHQVIHWECLR